MTIKNTATEIATATVEKAEAAASWLDSSTTLSTPAINVEAKSVVISSTVKKTALAASLVGIGYLLGS